MKKCNKCDERGYITIGKYGRKSCKCGFAISEQKKKFDEMFGGDITKMISFLNIRKGISNK